MFERALIAGLAREDGAGSLGFDLAALQRAAGQIRDRLAPGHWRAILTAREELRHVAADPVTGALPAGTDVLPVLERVLMLQSAITGKQTDRMTRDDGWRLLTIGRVLERLIGMAGLLRAMHGSGALACPEGFALLLHLFDSAITYRAHYQRRIEMVALIDLLVMDVENPRSLASCVTRLRSGLARLPAPGAAADLRLADALPDPQGWQLAQLCERDADGRWQALDALARSLIEAAARVSDEIGMRWFAHADAGYRTMGA